MIFIYPYKRKGDDFIIQQSVRLVRKYYPDAQIYTVGDEVEGIENIPCKDKFQIRGCNVTYKVLYASQFFDEFIYMNDDFIINDRFNFDRVYGGVEDLERKEGKASIEWQVSTDNSKHWLEHNGYNVRTYECHQPVKFNSKALQRTFERIDWKNNEHFLKSIYCNVNESDNMLPIENTKLIKPNISKANLLLNIYGCFSIGEGFLTQAGVDFIKSL